MAKSVRLELADNIFRTLEIYFQLLWRNWPVKLSNSVKKMQNKGYYAVQGHSRSFMVIEVGINRKPVCNFLLVINTNWHPISYRFAVIAAYCSNFGHCVFWGPLWGEGLRTTYDVHLGLIEKHVVDFILVLIELFSLGWGAASEYRLKIGDFAPTGSVWPQIWGRRGRPHQPSSCHKTRVNDLSCGIRMRAQLFFVLSQITRVADGQTERQISHR